MRKIDVQITKGKIDSFSVSLDKEFPVVSATVSLFTADDKEITSFSLSSAGYSSNPFKVPISMIPGIKDLADKLENIAILHCNKKMAMLPAPEAKVEVGAPV